MAAVSTLGASAFGAALGASTFGGVGSDGGGGGGFLAQPARMAPPTSKASENFLKFISLSPSCEKQCENLRKMVFSRVRRKHRDGLSYQKKSASVKEQDDKFLSKRPRNA
jgi:hypothetical protein